MLSKLHFVFLFICLSVFSQKTQEQFLVEQKASIIEKGKQAFFSKDIPQLLKVTNEIDSLYLKTNDSTLLAKYYHFKALSHKLTYANDSAFYYYYQSKNISQQLKDSLNVGKRLLSIVVLQKRIKDYLGSEISAIEALKYLETIKSHKYLERVFNNLGLISNALNQEEEALYYYNKALFHNKIINNNIGYLNLMNNLGLLYQQQNEHEKAIEYFKKGLAFNNIKFKHPIQYALLLENLTFSELALGVKENTISRYNEVLKIREQEKDFGNLSITHVLLSEFYQDENNITKAKFHANEALKYAKQTHNNKRWLEALQILSELNTGKKAVGYLNEYIQLNDSLLQKERSLKNQFAKIRYETAKKEKENSVLKIENEKNEAEIVYHKQQKTIGWLFFVISLFGLGFSVLFFVLRRKRLIYQNKLQKIEAREKERRQIAKSLHDEVAGDLRLLHQKLQKSQLFEEAQKLDAVKENVRGLSHKLSSISFEKVSFKDQVVNLVSDYFEPNFVIQIKGINEHEWTAVDNTIKRLLYLSMRECIQNCQKYAEATKVTLDFSVRKKYVFLSIIDNGIGFDTNKSKKGIGLQNLEERLEDLNGTLAIESEPNNGTKIYIQIPLNAYKS